MRHIKLIIFTLLGLFATGSLHASGGPSAVRLFDIFNLPITNSILTSWIISLALIFAIRSAVKVPKLNPSKGQAFVEIILEGVENLVSPIVGKHMFKPTFWLLSGIFLYVCIHNWSGLLPGVGTFGMGYDHGEGVHITKAFFRPANADLNMTAALASVAMISWLYYILKYAGLKAVIKDLFGNKADKKEVSTVIYIFLAGIFLFVGVIEIISIILRPVTLSFRLFGNVFGGESLLAKMFELSPAWFPFAPTPFYFMELLVGFVQALVFTLLVSVYIGLICNHDSGGEDHH